VPATSTEVLLFSGAKKTDGLSRRSRLSTANRGLRALLRRELGEEVRENQVRGEEPGASQVHIVSVLS
jgi:hypothetical protein